MDSFLDFLSAKLLVILVISADSSYGNCVSKDRLYAVTYCMVRLTDSPANRNEFELHSDAALLHNAHSKAQCRRTYCSADGR